MDRAEAYEGVGNSFGYPPWANTEFGNGSGHEKECWKYLGSVSSEDCSCMHNEHYSYRAEVHVVGETTMHGRGEVGQSILRALRPQNWSTLDPMKSLCSLILPCVCVCVLSRNGDRPRAPKTVAAG